MCYTAVDTLSGVIILLVLCVISSLSDSPEARLVQTLQGPVRGYKDAVEDIFVFYGIPYATAPTGENRFKAPQPGPIWLTALEAVNNKIICPQVIPPGLEVYVSLFQMQENCLIANVYVPNTNQTNIPVAVYVHGGGFQIGFGSYIEPKKLVAKKNIIVVTFNYRLGAHGFLCLGTEDAPGNAGMKDQVALLRWVKNNIASFGGNPINVTIGGYSAGGASVDLLMISPLAKNLFNKVIPESGGSLAAFAMQSRPIDNAKEFARKYNASNVDDICALEKFYKTASFTTLISNRYPDRKDTSYLFTPCVEKKSGTDSFLTDTPYNILSSGSYKIVPVLFGFNNMEGLLRLVFFDTWKNEMNSKFTNFLPAFLKFKNEREKNRVANKVKTFYFGNETVSNNTILSYIDYFSDVGIIFPIMKSVQLLVKSGHKEVYLYEYSFYDNNTATVPYTNVKGAAHGDQTSAVFDSANENRITEEFKQMKEIMRHFWGNFIITGNPVPAGSFLPSWPPTDACGEPIMSLGRTVELRSSYPKLRERMRLWDEIYNKYYRQPTPPSHNDTCQSD